MDEKIKSLWESNKIFFFLLLPILIIIIFKDLILGILIGSARKVSEAAKKQDEILKEDLNKQSLEAQRLKDEADAAAKRIADRKEGDIPDDWNKK